MENKWSDFCCPLCKGALCEQHDSYDCDTCQRHFPVVLGIPDFRVFPDPYIDFEEDREKGLKIAERYFETDFHGLVEYYWSLTPDVTDDMAQRYIRYAMIGAQRGRHLFESLESSLNSKCFNERRARRFLELGCRTGGLLCAAAEHSREVVGIDIAYRWLVVAKKQLEENGVEAQLVCCCAEYLPFPAERFDLVVAENVLEHTKKQQQLIQEAYRVTSPRGIFAAITCNRFSLGPEPHVRVWGVGWLPRSWMNWYVRRVKGVNYEHVRLLSAFELLRMVRRIPFAKSHMTAASLCKEQQEGGSRLERWLIAIYHTIKNWPVIRSLLLLFGPVLQLICIRK